MSASVGKSTGSTSQPDADDCRQLEWTTARQIIADADGRLSTLRQYGATFVAAILTAQGLIEVPPVGSSTYVPPTIRLAIVVASQALILALFVNDVALQSIQRDVAFRAQELERGLGMELTESSQTLLSRSGVLIIGAMYGLFATAAGIIGFAVLPTSAAISGPFAIPLDWLDLFALIGAVVIILWVGWGQRRARTVAWSLDRYRCFQGDIVAVTLTYAGPAISAFHPSNRSRPTDHNPVRWWSFKPASVAVSSAPPSDAQSPAAPVAVPSPATNVATPGNSPSPLPPSPPTVDPDPLDGPTIEEHDRLGPGDLRTWWWDTGKVPPGAYYLHHFWVPQTRTRTERLMGAPAQRHRSVLVERRPRQPPGQQTLTD